MVYQNPKINSLVDNVISVPIAIMHRSARSLNIPPAHPPLSPPPLFQRNARASDRRRYLGGGEFEPCFTGVGKLNLKYPVSLAEYKSYIF